MANNLRLPATRLVTIRNTFSRSGAKKNLTVENETQVISSCSHYFQDIHPYRKSRRDDALLTLSSFLNPKTGETPVILQSALLYYTLSEISTKLKVCKIENHERMLSLWRLSQIYC